MASSPPLLLSHLRQGRRPEQGELPGQVRDHDDGGHDTSGQGDVGRAEEVHGEGQDQVSHVPMLPEEDDIICGHQEVCLESGGGKSHGAGRHLYSDHPDGCHAQAQCPKQVSHQAPAGGVEGGRDKRVKLLPHSQSEVL